MRERGNIHLMCDTRRKDLMASSWPPSARYYFMPSQADVDATEASVIPNALRSAPTLRRELALHGLAYVVERVAGRQLRQCVSHHRRRILMPKTQPSATQFFLDPARPYSEVPTASSNYCRDRRSPEPRHCPARGPPEKKLCPNIPVARADPP